MKGCRGPVGVLDSGVGGLSVCRAVRARLPGADLLYFADSAHAPYGERTADAIRGRTLAIGHRLIAQGARTLLVACNTATAAAVDLLRAELTVPVIGMEPAVKPAAAATRSGVVGVLATTGTAASVRFAALLDRFAGNVRVLVRPCPGWVERVERGDLDGPGTRGLVERYVRPLVDAGADTLVLGCTHYAFLAPLIGRIAGPDVALIETGEAVARQLEIRLRSRDLLCESSRPGGIRILTSAEAERTHAVTRRLWPEPAEVTHATVDSAPLEHSPAG